MYIAYSSNALRFLVNNRLAYPISINFLANNESYTFLLDFNILTSSVSFPGCQQIMRQWISC